MIAINQRVEVPAGDTLGLGVRFPDRADDARLLALQHRRRKLGALEDARKQTERLLHFLGAAQRAQRPTGAVAVEAAGKLRSDISHAARDLVLRKTAGTELERLRPACRGAVADRAPRW